MSVHQKACNLTTLHNSDLEIMQADIILGANPTEANVKGQLVVTPNKTMTVGGGT